MCGITGFIDHNHQVSETNFSIAAAALVYNNLKDNSHIVFEQKEHFSWGIAHEQIATIDLSVEAQQPLTSTCGNYTITFNGTIYNFIELRETLIKYGVIFTTLSDTEVILECYKKWGTQAFEKFDGAFAFTIVDRKQHQLIIARDQLGSKPLYYYKKQGIYAFASEIRTLLSYISIERNINKNAMLSFFRHGYFNGEETIYQDIYRFKKGGVTIIDMHSGNSYETLFAKKTICLANTDDTEENILIKIEDFLTESILNRNVANVPVGVLLSGGYDSTTVAAILQKNQTKKIKTFTVGFLDKKFNEAQHANQIAKHLKTNHQEFYLTEENALDIAHKLPEIFDEPIGDSSVIPLIYLAKELQNDIKVLLGCEAGDELFGGYRNYGTVIKLNKLKQKNIPQFIKDLIFGYLKAANPKIKEVLATDVLLDQYLGINACFTYSQLQQLFNTTESNDGQANEAITDIKGLLIYDLNHYLPNNLLFKCNKSFMHFGIDHRDAILKKDLVNYLATLDAKWFIKDGEQKYLLKKITHKYVPANLMKPKRSFAIPLAKWLKTSFKPLVDLYLSPQKLAAHNLFNTKEVSKIKSAFEQNGNAENAQKVWLVLQFQMWYDKWMA